MVIQRTQFSISTDHFKAFMKASHDCNPLHTDISYARRTFFGETVFYGMGSVLIVLAIWAKGRPFKLSSIQGSFHRPLMAGRSYSVEITEDNFAISAKILDHGMLMSKVSWEAVFEDNFNRVNYSQLDFKPLLESSDPVQTSVTPDYRKYAFNPKALVQIEKYFGLSSKQLPQSQLTALFWASYFVGMEYPGRRALFSNFSFDFLNKDSSHIFEARQLRCLHNPTFDLIEISGVATCLRSLKISAYRIPEVVNYHISEVASVIGKSWKLKGKKIFVSGATRGFGSVLSKAFALQGATILLNCRKKDSLALQVQEEIKSIGGFCYLVKADLSQETSIEHVRKEVSDYVGMLDWIVNNASPRIHSRKFTEQTTEDFLNFVDESFSIVLNTCSSLLPILSEKGWVFGISSAYLDTAKGGFSHYLASKSALEGFLLGLAQEYKKHNFAIFRAPRMLTDQTNVAADLNRPSSALNVARKFLDAFKRRHGSGNFYKLV